MHEYSLSFSYMESIIVFIIVEVLLQIPLGLLRSGPPIYLYSGLGIAYNGRPPGVTFFHDESYLGPIYC